MAEYKNYIDQFLAEYTPDWEEVGLAGAVESGKEQLDRTHKYVEEDFLEGLSDDTNVHTMLPAGGKGVRKGKGAGMHGQHRNTDYPVSGEALPKIRSSQVINRTAKAMSDESVFDEVVMDLEAAKGYGTVEQRNVSDAEVERYIKKMLNAGVPPVKVAGELSKMAELMLFNQTKANDYLTRNAGLLGLAYIQPNEFMNSCPKTMEKLNIKGAGKLAAKSVKQINACTNCSFFSKDASSKTCNLYHLPIVGTQNELLTIVNKMTAGVPTAQKKAALVKQANKGVERTPLTNNIASERPVQKTAHTTPEATRERVAHVTPEISARDIAAAHTAGHDLETIYKHASRKVGSAKATKAVREFIASLKTGNTKIALSQIDCTFLKNKLGVQNAIVGAAKCGSCTYRKGMHCGMTGGTLVSFPGMDKQASNHKIAAGAPKSGKALLEEYDLTAAAAPQDIELNASGPERLDVKIGSVMELGDIE